jgi:hypothetical protein
MIAWIGSVGLAKWQTKTKEHRMTSKSRDHLTETTEQGKIELKEWELKRITGGFFKKVPVTTRSGLLRVDSHKTTISETQTLSSDDRDFLH